MIKEADMAHLYAGVSHFRDRHKGADNFERILQIPHGMCVHTFLHAAAVICH